MAPRPSPIRPQPREPVSAQTNTSGTNPNGPIWVQDHPDRSTTFGPVDGVIGNILADVQAFYQRRNEQDAGRSHSLMGERIAHRQRLIRETREARAAHCTRDA
jgi:hypothetical protein